eukprot:GHUV01034645.1.p2 GENE.GHUV01034645.1~~GHUV01034645.1.p2  ORF type:complete len:146 (-),score=24.53 GHUV01034645.1:725-1162(-)
MCMLVPDESRASHIGWCAGHSALIAFCIVSILLIDVGCCTQTGPTAGRNVMAPLNSTEQAVLVSEDIIKPRCDKLGYRSITLPNKLRVLLISDPDTDKAAAALNVSGWAQPLPWLWMHGRWTVTIVLYMHAKYYQWAGDVDFVPF